MLPDELKNKYQILQLLHHGIGGDVWLTEHKALGGKRILKTVEKSHPQYKELVREAKILQQCQHSSIPIIYDILEFDTQTYIVLEFIQGETLKQYVLRQRSISAALLLELSIQLCNILIFLHNPARQILHLDIKPENILLVDHRMKLIDFGSAICRRQQETNGVIFGTPAYCAPEMKTMGKLTEQTDIYCMGKCMEYLFFHTPKAPKGYKNIVDVCLRKTGVEYTSADQILKELEKLKCRNYREKNREVWYAVTGVLSEQDAGMTALQVAAFLQRSQRKPVLFLDCTEERLMECLEQSENKMQKPEEQRNFVFERGRITVAKRVMPQEIGGWRSRGYACVVVCFGTKLPSISEVSFQRCILSGAVTGFNLKQWKEVLLSLRGRYCTAVALTGGDRSLAERELGEVCHVEQLPTYFEDFGQTENFRRQIKRLLRKR